MSSERESISFFSASPKEEGKRKEKLKAWELPGYNKLVTPDFSRMMRASYRGYVKEK